jgi:multidrug efflux pump subunit AcrB
MRYRQRNEFLAFLRGSANLRFGSFDHYCHPRWNCLFRFVRVQRAAKIIQATPGVHDAVAFAGFSGATFTNASNSAAIFAPFDSFEDRLEKGISQDKIIGQLFGQLQSLEEAFIIAIPPPPVRGIGNSGGFKIQLQERLDSRMDRVLAAAYELMGRAAQTPRAKRPWRPQWKHADCG